MALYENSRYLHTPIYNRFNGSGQMLKIRERFIFDKQECTLYEWVIGDTLDGVAYRQYGFCALRWAILDANPKYRTEFDIEPGDILLIPNYEEVVDLVNV